MIWLKFQIGGQERKDRTPWRLLKPPARDCGQNGTHVCACVFFKAICKGVLVPKELRTLREELLRA